jgi:hypothetical protein
MSGRISGARHLAGHAHADVKDRSIFVPLGHAKYFGSVELGLNSRSTQSQQVTPTWYIAGGGTVVGAPISVDPSHVEFHSLSDYLPANVTLSPFEGLELSYVGRFREIWAQATLVAEPGADPSQSLDANFTLPGDFKSARLEAVWAGRPSDEIVLALANTSAEQIAVTVSHGGNHQEVILSPRAGSDLKIPAAQNGTGADWIELESSGPPAALRATGLVLSPNGKQPRLLRFFDPAAAAQEKLFATGLRVTGHSAMALKNTTDGAVSAVVELQDPEDGHIISTVPSVLIPARQGVSVNLAPVSGLRMDRVNVRVRNTGGAGSLIGSIHSKDASAGVAFEVPLRDSGPIRGSAGAYPLRIDGDYRSIVTITNVGEVAGTFIARIVLSAGVYVFKPIKLNIGQSSFFDVLALRDQQVPDAFGHKLPLGLQQAQFRWSLHAPTTARFAGRGEMVSLNKHVSSSYSCGTCCPDSYFAGHAYPGSLNLDAGDTATVDITEELEDCYGSRYEVPAAPQSISYDHDVILAGLEGSQVTVDTIDEGSTSVSLEWTSYIFWEIGDEQCMGDSVGANAGFQTQVTRPTLGGSGCDAPTRGANVTFSLNHLSQNATVSNWRFESGYGNVSRQTNTSDTSWSGPLITTGIAKVKVNTQNREFNLQCEPVMQSRNMTWSAVSSTEVSSGLYTFNVPPSPSDYLGAAVFDGFFNVTVQAIGDDGPNTGIKWISALSQSNNSGSTRFRYQISEAASPNNEFYQKQCGNWDGSTGFISGSRMRTNVIEHEGGSQMGHYKNYTVSNSTNNPGNAAEGYLGQLSESLNNFQQAAVAMLEGKLSTISSDAASHAGVCNVSASYGPDCTYYGPGNYPPYASCVVPGVQHEPPRLADILLHVIRRPVRATRVHLGCN